MAGDGDQVMTAIRLSAPPPAQKVPWCALCEKPVDGFMRIGMQRTREVRFVALCHGAREEVVMDERLLHLFRGETHITMGKAFAGKLIEGEKP